MKSFVVWDQVEEDLKTAEFRVSDVGLAMMVRTMLMPIVEQDSQENIPNQQSPRKRAWKPLKESTKRVRASLNLPGILPDRPINVRTQKLHMFIMSARSEVLVAPGYVQGTWPANVTMDSSRLMYAYHTAQAGSKRWGTPPRPIVGLSAEAILLLGVFSSAYFKFIFTDRGFLIDQTRAPM